MTNALVKTDTRAPTNQGGIIQLVTFELGSEEYGVDVLSVREIIRMTPITAMPNAPEYVEGVINLRGTVVPILSLRQRFCLPSLEIDSHSRILVMEMANGKLIGFVVDGVAEVIRVTADNIQPPPDVVVQQGAQECIAGILQRDERLLIVIDLARLFDGHELAEEL